MLRVEGDQVSGCYHNYMSLKYMQLERLKTLSQIWSQVVPLGDGTEGEAVFNLFININSIKCDMFIIITNVNFLK